MKTLSTQLKEHMAGEVTTLAMCWKVIRQDGAIYGFTSASSKIVFEDISYEASTGQIASNIKTTSQLNVDNLEVQSILDSESFVEADVLAGLWDFAIVEIFVVNYKDLTQGSMTLRRGTLGNVRVGKTVFTAELRGMMQALQQTVGRVYTAACDANLGDTRCGVTIGTYTVAGVVTSVTEATNKRTFVDSSLSAASGYFDGGLITWLTGNNTGYSMEVKTYNSAGDIVVLQLNMPNAIQVGDTYTITAGCDKTLDTCRTKFNNVVNFRGFPHIPGRDRLFSGD